MAYTFFYLSALILWIIFAIAISFRPMDIRHVVIGIATAAVSLAFDTILGTQLRLYHYIDPSVSSLYIALAGVLIYPPTNMIYILFLPREWGSLIKYTLVWMGAMLLFEYASILTGTVVFTGWRPVPWSFVTYIFSYIWVVMLYRYLSDRKLSSSPLK